MRQDESCQKQLFVQYSKRMMTVCIRYARTRSDAEDILQDGFVRLFRKIQQYKFEGSFEGWMRKIFVNTALKKYRNKRFEKERTGIEDVVESPCDPGVLASLSADEILQWIGELPEGYRIVFNMYAIEGYSHKEIAEMLGCTEATSRSQLLKARKHLQKRIQIAERIAS